MEKNQQHIRVLNYLKGAISQKTNKIKKYSYLFDKKYDFKFKSNFNVNSTLAKIWIKSECRDPNSSERGIILRLFIVQKEKITI